MGAQCLCGLASSCWTEKLIKICNVRLLRRWMPARRRHTTGPYSWLLGRCRGHYWMNLCTATTKYSFFFLHRFPVFAAFRLKSRFLVGRYNSMHPLDYLIPQTVSYFFKLFCILAVVAAWCVLATYDATKTHRNTQSRLQCVLKYVPRPTQTDDLV